MKDVALLLDQRRVGLAAFGGLADPHLEHNPAVVQFAQTFDGGAAGSGLQPHGDFQPLSGVS
jgi:hypothetical protein